MFIRVKKMNLKIVILGDASVGKSLLVAEKYHSDYISTFGGELTVRKMIVNEQIMSIQFWDMPGRRSIPSCCTIPYYQDADCCVLMYDVTSLESFESLVYWRAKFLAESSVPNKKRFPFIVVGNKIDLDDRTVDKECATLWSKNMDIFLYLEMSAKNPTNVTKALQIIVQSVLDYKGNLDNIHDSENSTTQNSRSCYGSLLSRLFNLLNIKSIIDDF